MVFSDGDGFAVGAGFFCSLEEEDNGFVPLHFNAPITTPICMMCPLLEVQCISNWTTDLDLYLGVNQELWFGKELEI